jgi:chromosome partitioning protein
MNMKGGVGKTTVTAHLAGFISRYALGAPKPRSVLAIDYDPQFNLSQAFISPAKYFQIEKKRKTILSVLMDDGVDLDPFKIQVPGSQEPPKVDDLIYTEHSYANGGAVGYRSFHSGFDVHCVG